MKSKYFVVHSVFKAKALLLAAMIISSAVVGGFSGTEKALAQEEEKTTKNFDSQVTGNPVRLDVDAQCSIKSAVMKPESANTVQDSGYNYPEGFMHFTIDCDEDGFTANVKQVYFNAEKEFLETDFRKYNPNTNAYFNVSGADIAKELFGSYMATITYQVKDGGSMDMDGVTNGIIVDPAGLALQAVTPPKTGFGGALNNLIIQLFVSR